jgi:hypothetical protein
VVWRGGHFFFETTHGQEKRGYIRAVLAPPALVVVGKQNSVSPPFGSVVGFEFEGVEGWGEGDRVEFEGGLTSQGVPLWLSLLVAREALCFFVFFKGGAQQVWGWGGGAATLE